MNKNLIAFVIIVLALGVFKSSYGQYNQQQFIRNQSLTLGFHAKLWELDNDTRFFEAALPVVFSVPVGRRFAIDVVTAPFITALEPDEGKVLDFSSVTDSYIRGSYIIGDNRALLTVGVGLPSGKTELDSEELALAGIAANRPLANPVTNFGTGLNVSVGLALAHEIGSWVFGVGVGYSRRGEYNLNSQSAKIDPGDEFNITVGVDKEFGSAKFMADLIYTTYSKDESELLDPYKAGEKLLLNGRLMFPLGFLNPIVLSAGNRTRKNNETANPALLENGNEFEFRATATAPFGNSFGLKFIYLTRIYGDTDQSFDGANIHGFGGGVILRLSRHFTFDPALIYSTGSINTGPNSEIDVTGIELTGGFAFRF
ncbi:MAG: hypothetical protein ACE5IR_13595 [bacterium]